MLKRLSIIVLVIFLFCGIAFAAETQEINTLPSSSEVELYGVEAQMCKDYSGSAIPGVRFKLKNIGKDIIEDVEVVIFFKDKDGKAIAEESYHPLRKTFTTSQKLLKPGYIWQVEKDKFFLAPNVPSEWKVGAVEGKIANIIKKK